jgi:ATP-dependent Clp protease protease subunit
MTQQKLDTVYINFCDQFIQPKTQALMNACAEIINQRQPKTLYLCLSGSSGMVADAITVYSFLRGLPVRLITHNIGSLDVIATIVFLAGEERYASPATQFLLNGVHGQILGPSSVAISQFQEIIKELEEDQNRIINLMRSRTQLTESELKELFKQRASKSPEFAKSKGIINEIRDLAISAGAPIASLNLP